MKLSIAPMMDWTDRHYRFMMRLITKHTLLYTPMITTGALLHGPREHLLAYSPEEHPLAIQLGGDNPAQLAHCSRMAHDHGYIEVNLNVGCPSDRVQNGNFGACLMKQPERVAECVAAIRAAVPLPVTVKHRIGVDDHDSDDHLAHFINTVSAAGCDTFIVHARKAWLQGLSPRQNRSVPPLRHEVVHRLKRDFPHLNIVLNGGIKTLEEAQQHLKHVDGAMLGRAAYERPWMLAHADRLIFGDDRPVLMREDICLAMREYAEKRCAEGLYVGHITRHMLNLFAGEPNARRWRRHLSEQAHRVGANPSVITAALYSLKHRPQIIDASHLDDNLIAD